MLTQDYRDRPDNDGCQGRWLALVANVFFASTLDVILQRLMPPYRLRQTGESTTLLLKATQNESNRTQKETPKLGARVFRRKTAVYLRVNGSLLASGRLDDIAQAVTRRQTQ